MPEKTNQLTELEKTELEIKRLELENLELENEERKLNLINKRQDIDQRKMNEEQQFAVYRERGVVLADQSRNEAMGQEYCTHRKGGIDMHGLMGNGDDTDYAVWKIKWFDGKMWVRCLRCAKTWKPVRMEMFAKVEKGKPVAPLAPHETLAAAIEAYTAASADYKAACAFPTKNQPSGTTQYQFSDSSRYNEIMDGITLR
jgi:hypothetical protein